MVGQTDTGKETGKPLRDIFPIQCAELASKTLRLDPFEILDVDREVVLKVNHAVNNTGVGVELQVVITRVLVLS